MPNALTKTRTKRKPSSAVAGGALLTRRDMMTRWGMSYRSILKREKEGLLVPIKLGNDQNVRYRLRDIEKVEADARTKN